MKISVIKIVEQYLRENGYDGLAGDDCGCDLDNLAPCGECFEGCQAGHKVPCDCGEGHDFHIRAGRKNDDRPVCECGEKCNPSDEGWRWNGSNWQHYHGCLIGHVDVLAHAGKDGG